MRILVVDAYPTDDPDRSVTATAVDLLKRRGHQIDLIELAGDEYTGFMSADERTAYETDEPLRSAITRDSADRARACDALLFCYPTVMFGVPPRLKSWIERVMVSGVAFNLGRLGISPALKNVRRLGAVTTTPHTRAETRRAGDLGYRTIMRTLRLNCNPRCRRTHVVLRPGTPRTNTIERRLGRW